MLQFIGSGLVWAFVVREIFSFHRVAHILLTILYKRVIVRTSKILYFMCLTHLLNVILYLHISDANKCKMIGHT